MQSMQSPSPVFRPAYLALSLLLLSSTPTLAVDPTGEWLVAQGWARIKVANCNDRLWGIVSWEARPATDRNNPDPALRNRPVLGMPILLGIRQSQPNRWDGRIYNSEDGRTYDVSVGLANPNVLRVRGCMLGALCGGQNWTRVGASASASADAYAQSPGRRGTRDRASAGSDVCARVGAAQRPMR
jgi:uncharacterized protein (DUF2147 family)